MLRYWDAIAARESESITPTLSAERIVQPEIGYPVSIPEDFPASDGVPMESAWQRDQMGLCIELLEANWKGKRFYRGGNMFIHYAMEQLRTRKLLSPDFFVVLGVDQHRTCESRRRKSRTTTKRSRRIA